MAKYRPSVDTAMQSICSPCPCMAMSIVLQCIGMQQHHQHSTAHFHFVHHGCIKVVAAQYTLVAVSFDLWPPGNLCTLVPSSFHWMMVQSFEAVNTNSASAVTATQVTGSACPRTLITSSIKTGTAYCMDHEDRRSLVTPPTSLAMFF